MTSRIRIAFAVLAAALALSACSSASVAATVNGKDITDDDVTGIRTAGTGDVIAGEQFRNDLTTLIVSQATLDAAEADYGITGLDTPAAREAWLAEASPEELDIVASVATNPDLTENAADVVTTQLMVRQAVFAAFMTDDEVLQTIWDDYDGTFVAVCARHLLVATEEEANAARDRILAGEDFATVADEISLDPSTEGGMLECPSSPDQYVDPFSIVVANVPVGEVTEPFETEFGWHIVLVESRESPASFEEFAADAGRWVSPSTVAAVWSAWRDQAVGEADITVRSQVGEWFPQGDGILPPPASP